MAVTIKVFANLREIVGAKAVELDLEPDLPLEEVLEEVFLRYPALRDEILTPEREIRPYVNVMLNGRSVRFLEGLKTPIPSGAQLALFPPVAGGAGQADPGEAAAGERGAA